MGIARVRVELKNMGRSEYDRIKAHKLMRQEFRKRVDDAGLMHLYKEYQFFESKSVKKRKKRKEMVAKRKQDDIEQKILLGEKVEGNQKIVKKIMSLNRKKKRKKKTNRRDDFSAMIT